MAFETFLSPASSLQKQRGATLFAINSLMIRTDILTLCDPGSKQQGSDGSAMSLSMSHSPFMNLFLQYCIHRTNLVDRSSIPGSPILSSPLATTLGYEAQTSGSEIDVSLLSLVTCLIYVLKFQVGVYMFSASERRAQRRIADGIRDKSLRGHSKPPNSCRRDPEGIVTS